MSSGPPSQLDPPRRHREVTLAAVLFGLVVGAAMNASITYAGLKLGFTIGGSAIAAILGFGFLRGILRKGTILETNISQTVASAVNIPNSGVIFTIPVLFLLPEYRDINGHDPRFWMLVLACTMGAILGCVFIIPLRKQMIEIDRLRFPTGTAVAELLKAPGAGVAKARVLVMGILIGAVVYLPAGLPTLKFKAPLEELDGLVKVNKIKEEEARRTRQIHEWMEAEAIPPEVAAKGKDDAAKVQAGLEKGEKVDQFAITAYQVSEGETTWKKFADQFWAKKPLWGYGDLNLRVAAPPPPEETEVGELRAWQRDYDRDADGARDLIVTHDSMDVGRLLGIPGDVLFLFAIAPFALGAGYITGRPGLMVLAGGVLAFFVLNPVAFRLLHLMPESTVAHEVPKIGGEQFNRPIGIGMLLGGALMGILFSLPSMIAAMKSIAAAASGRGKQRGSDELGLKPLVIAGVICVIGLWGADYLMSDQETARQDKAKAEAAEQAGAKDAAGGENVAANEQPQIAQGWLSGLSPVVRSLMIAVVGVVWIWFAGIIISQCTGMTDWSPISGMALLTVVLVMLLSGPGDVLGAVLIGAALCVAVTLAADMMQDLKTGHLIGAVPRKQQLIELVTTGIGPVISMGVLLMIVAKNMKTYGVPLGEGTDTTAPQAVALGKVIEGMQHADMPYMLYVLGAVLGVLLGLGGFPGLGVLVGLSMYLPIQYILTYGVGCIVYMIVARVKGRRWAEEWGVPLAAGLIVGEALVALAINGTVLLVS